MIVGYDNLAEVQKDFTEGDLERAEAIQVLMDEFNMDENEATTLIDMWTEGEE